MLPEAGTARTIAGVFVVVCVGCGDAPPPTSPTPVPSIPERPPVQYSLAGGVQDTAFRPVADVRIEVVEGQRAGVSVLTNARGRYELPGLSGMILVRASKDGYVPVAKRHDPSSWNQEQHQLSFSVELSVASVNLTGTYTLRLTADSACTRLPADLRTRTYPVSIAPNQRPSGPHQYEGALSGGTFLPSPLVGRFQVNVAGTDAYFYLGNPYDWIDAIVEELAPSTYLAIWGFGELPVGESPIAGSLAYGGFEYCVSPTNPVVNGWYRCPAEPVTCGLQRLQLDRQ